MNTILEQYADKINGTFSFYDRMFIKDFSAHANTVTNGLVSYVEAMTASMNRPLIYLTSAKTSKEQTALGILNENPVGEGLICTLSAVEYCQTLQPLKNEKEFHSLFLFLSLINQNCIITFQIRKH